jgi:hypothetical protein
MLVRNDTPFPHFCYRALDLTDALATVVICRATYAWNDEGICVRAVQQSPVVLADKYAGDPLNSSVLLDSDLVPVKPQIDVTVQAVAYSPRREPATHWDVGFNVGPVQKCLRVHGRRVWRHTRMRGWIMSPPTPVEYVRLEYERAYGGRYLLGADAHVWEENPAGVGFFNARQSSSEPQEAPQVEFPNDPVHTPGKTHRPAGIGAVAKHWLPRRNLCGTADGTWLNSRWPLRPLDFTPEYYQSAPVDQRMAHPCPESLSMSLLNLTRSGRESVLLNLEQLVAFCLWQGGRYDVLPLRQDTIHIDVDERTVAVTQRCIVPDAPRLKSLQIAHR